MQLWGIGGQERFAHLTSREARGAFVLYDMSRPKTLAGALKWKQNIEGKVTLPNGDDIPCVLLATKCDCAVDAPLDLEDFARKNGFTAVYRTSAKLGEGVGEAVNELVRQMVATEGNITPGSSEHAARVHSLEEIPDPSPQHDTKGDYLGSAVGVGYEENTVAFMSCCGLLCIFARDGIGMEVIRLASEACLL